MPEITGPNTQVGILKVQHAPEATITADGVWHCPGNLEYEQSLNETSGPKSTPLGPSVIPHALRALRTAAHQLRGEVELSIDWQKLPPGVIS